MKRSILLTSVILFLFVSAGAQDHPKVEIFGGYSHMRRSGEGLNGWNVSLMVNRKRWFGVFGDFSHHRRTLRNDSQSEEILSERNLISFVFGPRFSIPTRTALTPFAHILVGASTEPLRKGEMAAPGLKHTTLLTAGIGGGVDAAINRRIAIRLAQIDLLSVDSFNPRRKRISTGLVFRF